MNQADERCAAAVAEGKAAAAARWAALIPELRAEVEAAKASIPDILSRTFCSPPLANGHHFIYRATHAELAEWEASQ